jgi:hypothetical protein
LQGALRNLPRIIRTKSLHEADISLGEELEFLAPNRQWLKTKGASFGVVREIFGHRCYAMPESLYNAREILDLGGNAGIFTLYALTSAPSAHVHYVELQPHFVEKAEKNVIKNGFEGRVSYENAVVGSLDPLIAGKLGIELKELKIFSPTAYTQKLKCCDFIKCDIEGAEYALFSSDIAWLKNVDRVAVEYHGSLESGEQIKERLEQSGYRVLQRPHGTLGYLFANRNAR